MQDRSIAVSVRLRGCRCRLLSLALTVVTSALWENRRPCPNGTSRREVAEGIGTEVVDHLVGIDDVAAALGHLLAVHRPPAVGEDGRSGAAVQRHQHGGPVHGVRGENIFPDQMDIGGPVTSRAGRLSLRGYSRAGDVIDQRVEPDVGDVVLIEGKFDAPGEARFGSEIDRSPSFWFCKKPRTSLRRDSDG